MELVSLTIDGKKVSVPKGTNLIEAAKIAGIEIPYYCYHPHLSIAGNCRMCQVEVKGQPKLTIGCNTTVQEGMEVLTQNTSKQVEDAQAATLEFILINHPLDCTVCDQAGHCKLQDYHFEYNARPSRFLESKEHKVKAEPLGPTVILDGERCIMCTRCIRFCDEVTETSELGMLNRGDKSVISINPGKELNNPLSGTVVDLCPVGALTHREWRFNTRIWFTKQVDTICPGCSTGCNVRVAQRDNEVVQVKARLNSEVNKEWLCDEGRYGFERFLPKKRVLTPKVSGRECSTKDALKAATAKTQGDTLVLLGGDLLLEDYNFIKSYFADRGGNVEFAVGYKERTLSKVEAILISPDYAANFKGAEFLKLITSTAASAYSLAMSRLKSKSYTEIFIVGDRALLKEDQTEEVLNIISSASNSVAILTDAESALADKVKVLIPGRSVLEKSGLLINRKDRLQYSERCINYPESTEPEWRIFQKLSKEIGKGLQEVLTDRDATLRLLSTDPRLSGLKISMIKAGGIPLNEYDPKKVGSYSSKVPASETTAVGG